MGLLGRHSVCHRPDRRGDSGRLAGKLLLSSAPIDTSSNSAVALLQNDIGGTPSGIPWPHQWNGSLWTLIWEVLCYIGIAVAGVVGLLSRRWFIPALLALALVGSALLPTWVLSLLEEAATQRHAEAANDPATVGLLMGGIVARFAVMFLAGALVYQFRNVIPARWWLVALSVVIVLAASLLPNYRVIGGIPLAYAIIVSGASSTQALEVADGSVLRRVYLRVSGTAVIDHCWARQYESVCVRDRCSPSHPCRWPL